jgi:regulator of protease activity HflC (stomatin/prohibitin superfamily)
MTKRRYYSVAATLYMLAVILLLVFGSSYTSHIGGISIWNWGSGPLGLLGVYTLISLRIVGPTEVGAVLFFGKPLFEAKSGLVFVPLGICELVLETKLRIEQELPADPEFIDHGHSDEDTVKKGYFPPIRITFAEGKKENIDPLERRLTTEVVPMVIWQIDNFPKFLQAVGDREEARGQMADMAVSVFTEILTRISAATALKRVPKTNEKLLKDIKERTKEWGITVHDARIKTFGLSHDLNLAIQKMAQSSAEARATVIEAEATKTKRRLEGEGDGAAEQARLNARTAGFKKMADDLNVEPSVVFGAETARAVTENPGLKTIVMGTEGFKEIAGIASALSETFKTGEKPA